MQLLYASLLVAFLASCLLSLLLWHAPGRGLFAFSQPELNSFLPQREARGFCLNPQCDKVQTFYCGKNLQMGICHQCSLLTRLEYTYLIMIMIIGLEDLVIQMLSRIIYGEVLFWHEASPLGLFLWVKVMLRGAFSKRSSANYVASSVVNNIAT